MLLYLTPQREASWIRATEEEVEEKVYTQEQNKPGFKKRWR